MADNEERLMERRASHSSSHASLILAQSYGRPLYPHYPPWHQASLLLQQASLLLDFLGRRLLGNFLSGRLFGSRLLGSHLLCDRLLGSHLCGGLLGRLLSLYSNGKLEIIYSRKSHLTTSVTSKSSCPGKPLHLPFPKLPP